MDTKFIISSSPHLRSNEDVSIIMRDVVIALIPATVLSLYYFRLGALIAILSGVIGAVLTEALIQKLMGKEITINDYSAVITGLLVAFNVPASAPWWIPFVGSVFAISVVKQLFGGLGHNFMNPALAARAMLLASWPVEMTNWVTPGVDAVSTATPLAMLKTSENLPSIFDLFIGNIGGCVGETSALALIIGGIYLLYRKVITYEIPTYYIGTVAVLTFLLGGFDFNIVVYHLFAGGLMIGAFYMATDYASSPMTKKGQIIYAIGCGILTTVIRFYGGYPEGVSYSILLMNVATPLIDKYTNPRVFGEVSK
ncbi:electron transport complex protein RnfD [Alkalithermobacter thermoalcaliphilus JW-YL-7 = DSM 7308]|uniref:Ion-translocating oxidoreductase complex subunit D n=1 Tax=Alkalithermobacter thermoalcaliphilus JW-YL-7 = DSM 7308 TaxID=1121328 RepID=A0A150FRD9_CLOPD|nr:electron transport complex, RnfABCDGE type, D subunit [[Clostridium] paradoxum JW-YL-7 = DSM 7308]SHK44136.1 electron transport complex protein RnfD [[Clostridium] paradoxum JW-YL-7 = DSM 7308]